jgi:hypothetical protein
VRTNALSLKSTTSAAASSAPGGSAMTSTGSPPSPIASRTEPPCSPTVTATGYVDANLVTVSLKICIDSPSDGAAVVGQAPGVPITATGHGTVLNALGLVGVQIILGGVTMFPGPTVTRGSLGNFKWTWSGSTQVGTLAVEQRDAKGALILHAYNTLNRPIRLCIQAYFYSSIIATGAIRIRGEPSRQRRFL